MPVPPIEEGRVNSRERVYRAISFKKPDRIPLQHGVLPAALFRHGQGLCDLLGEYASDVYTGPWSIPSPEKLPVSYRRGGGTDEWGCVWANRVDGVLGQIVGRPLADWSRFGSYEFPAHASLEEITTFQKGLNAEHEAHVLAGGFNLFERMQWLRGYEQVLIDIATGAPEAYELRDALTEWGAEELRRWVTTNADGISLADDWGTQTALMIHPDQWRRIFLPSYRRFCEIAHQAGKVVHFHSDGMVWEIMEDLVDAGVDVLNVQQHVIGLERIARRFAGRICFRTDLDRQFILPRGTPEEVRQHVRQTIEALGSPRGGLIGHGEIGPDVPLENVRAMFQAFREFGVYNEK